MLRKFVVFFALCLLLIGCVHSPQKKSPQKDWGAVTSPTQQVSQVYGHYSAGCIDGAVALAANIPAIQTMRISRQRFYGHPRLIQFLHAYANTLYAKELGVLAIGDMAQARGGPMSSGHASHQLGLDVDIWFKRFSVAEKNALTLRDLELTSAVSMLSKDGLRIDRNSWTADQAVVLKLAATYAAVERIFVNPVIKKELCKHHKGEAWLAKIRPWWGHNYHYHIRLACPKNSPHCKSQNKVPNNDGCNESLAWWFTEEAKLELSTQRKRTPRKINLPAQCEKVLHDPA